MKISIQRITDSTECECCGCSIADGARVYFGDRLNFELTPIASCFDSVEFDDNEIYRKILAALNHNVVYSTEDGYFRSVILSLGHEICEI